MKLTTKVRYGLRSLVTLAQAEGKVLSISQIAIEQEISQNYLENIFAEFKKGGIVESVKGAKGGYRLIADPNSISIVEIVEMLDRDIHVALSPKRDLLTDVINTQVYEPLDKAVYSYLQSIKLGQIADDDIQNFSLF